MHKKILVMMATVGLILLSGCKKEDKLVLVTTEAQAHSETDATTEEDILADIREEAESTTEEKTVRKEASEEEKQITLEDIYNANKGDTLLADGENYALNTIYYIDDVEQYSEYQFLGFSEDGGYLQAYEDSQGVVQVLDKEHGYWFYVDENIVYALIYPEPSVADAIINANHNDMVISLTEADQTIRDIYREDDNLVVETDYINNSKYVFKYILDDTYKVLEYYCYDTDGQKLSYSWVTKGGEYELPDEISSVWEAMMTREVVFKFVDSDGLQTSYTVPINKPVQLALLEYKAYMDEECTVEWEESDTDDNGFFPDETIYLKRSAEEQSE